MTSDSVYASAVIDASAETIFGVLADPAKHAAIDGTGWVCEPLDILPLTASGQIFRMGMYHPDHPDGSYQTFNEVQVFDPPSAICWKPGFDAGDGTLGGFGGWTWRYDLAAVGPDKTRVTLTYDWSAVDDPVRDYIEFPPFAPDHLENSLGHLAELVAGALGTQD
jgi:hypothetical protein